jgi:hypothetical protein
MRNRDHIHMKCIRRRGGARIGWVSASWPLAGIEVDHGKVQVNSLGTYVFAPNEVTAVEPVGAIPFLSQGIRIHHTKKNYPERVVFYTLSSRHSLLEAIETAGFRVGYAVDDTKRGFPMRLPALIGVILIWNVLLYFERPSLEEVSDRPGPYTLLAATLMFALATLLPTSERLQKLFMRDGRDVGEILGALRLMQLISGIMLLALGADYLST